MSDVKDIDLGWKRIKKELMLIDNSYTKVGIQSDAGTEADGQNISAVGAYNEYGTKDIPARPFMRSTFDEQKAKLKSIQEKEYAKILAGKQSVKKALGFIGEFMTGEIKKKITTLRIPPNAPATIKAKKSTNPLIDTGRMRASITYVEFIKGKKGKGDANK